MKGLQASRVKGTLLGSILFRFHGAGAAARSARVRSYVGELSRRPDARKIIHQE